MTRVRGRALLLPLFVLVLAARANGQLPGTVSSHQKISDTQGGFTGVLDDGDYFGWATASIADLDGDGVDELAVGAPFDGDGGPSRGAVWVLFLDADGTVRSHQKISSTQGGFSGPLMDYDLFGYSVASLGDLDGDGVEDLAVGAVQDAGSGDRRGAVWVLFLDGDGTVKSCQEIADGQGGFTGTLDDVDYFGGSVASPGDLDGDQVPDLAVGAALDDDGGGNDRGAVWMLFLNADGTVKSHQKISDTQGGFTGTLNSTDLFGSSVASLGDLDGDGVVDVAVGAAGDDHGSQRGAVWVLFLNTDGTVRSHQKISDTQGGFTGVLEDGDLFGCSVASPGDLDGDGVGDLAVGAFGDDGGGSFRGVLWVLFLGSDGTVRFHQEIGDTQGGFNGTLDDLDYFGYSMTASDDLDADGVADLAVGAPGDADGGIARGAVWVMFLDGTPHASAKVRNGTGVNRPCYTDLTLPVLGTSWNTQIDHSGHPGASATVIVGKAFRASVLTTAGEVLIGGPRYFQDTVASSGAADVHSRFLPANLAFAGLSVSTQGLIVGGGLELCNAIDLVLGF